MALQKAYTDLYGIEHPNGYHMVDLVLDKFDRRAVITIKSFANEAHRHAEGARPMHSRTFIPLDDAFDANFGTAALSADGVNPYAKAYALVKQQEGWTDAQDC